MWKSFTLNKIMDDMNNKLNNSQYIISKFKVEIPAQLLRFVNVHAM